MVMGDISNAKNLRVSTVCGFIWCRILSYLYIDRSILVKIPMALHLFMYSLKALSSRRGHRMHEGLTWAFISVHFSRKEKTKVKAVTRNIPEDTSYSRQELWSYSYGNKESCLCSWVIVLSVVKSGLHSQVKALVEICSPEFGEVWVKV